MIVAEKPSVAMSYAKVLGATSRQDGYLEGNGYLVSWCVGHLVELAPPNIYDAKYVKWSIADLPILPQKWQYLVSASTKKQFGILKKLMHRADVDTVVNSCDSGREGELIFRLVYEQAGCKKPFSRLWLSSMEENAIREGFAHLKPSTEYDALYNAALCRERADWMVGINASRLFSCLYGQPLAVGRVMTPVLAMTVVREAAIAAFTPEKFYTVNLELTSGCTASSRRIPEKSVAENLLEACRKEMVATIQRITRKEKSENPPPLYDLTTLQRDANRLLGYSAQQTLDYVQSLGSIDIAAAVRSVMFIGKLKHDPTMRILTHEKSSLAPPGASLAFSLGDEGGFRWVGEYDITADEMLSGIEPQRETKTQQAKDLICTLLAGGKQVLSEDIDKAALERGIPGRTVRDAKRELGDALKSKIVEGRKKVFWME